MNAILNNWQLFASLLGALIVLFALGKKGLCRFRVSGGFFASLLLILLSGAGFFILLRLAVFSSSGGRETFFPCGPLFSFLFFLAEKASVLLRSLPPAAFPVSSLLILLVGLLALSRRGGGGRGAFWLAFSLALAINAQRLLIRPENPVGALRSIDNPLKIILYYLIAAGGAALAARYLPASLPGDRGCFWKKWGIILILLGTLVAGFYRLEQHPFTVNEYETDSGLSALQVIQGDPGYSKILWGYMERAYIASSFSPLFVYFLVGLFQAAGTGLLVLRAAGLFWGLAALGVFYFLIKGLFGARRALLAAFLMATGTWFLTVARLGTYSSLTLFYALTIIFIFNQALKTQNNICYYALAGALLGCNNYLYVVGKIIFPLLVLWWLHQLLLRRRDVKRQITGFILFLAFFLLISSLFNSPFRQLDDVVIKGQYVGAAAARGAGFSPAAALADFQQNLLYLVQNIFIENSSWAFPAPKAPLLNHGIFMLAILGIGFSAGRWKRGEYFLLLLWVFLAILPMTLISPLVDRGVGRRGILLIPVVAALAALPLDALVEVGRRTGKRALLILVGSGLAVFLAVTALHNLNVYFNRPEQAAYHQGDREFADQVVQLLKKGYHLEIVLNIHPQLTDRIIDFFAYPYTKNRGASFKYPPNSWGYPTRRARVGNTFYRYWEVTQSRELLEDLRRSHRKTAVLIGNSPVNQSIRGSIRRFDPSVRFEPFSDSRGRVIGYRYLTSP